MVWYWDGTHGIIKETMCVHTIKKTMCIHMQAKINYLIKQIGSQQPRFHDLIK
jgi:hypothetical protein